MPSLKFLRMCIYSFKLFTMAALSCTAILRDLKLSEIYSPDLLL